MTEQLCLSVLGPMEAAAGANRIALGGPTQQAVLAVLVASYPAPVPLERLADAIWSGRPPATYQSTLHAYVSRVRKLLHGWIALVLDAQGYRLVLQDAVIDSQAFDAAVTRAAVELDAGRLGAAVGLLSPALDSWRGTQALERWAVEPWARDFCAGLAEQRLAGAELLARAHLELGQPRAAAAALEALVAQRPYAESAARLLMIALYRDQRQGEALRLYDRCRRALADELGIDPSPALQQTHREVLTQHPQLDWNPPAGTVVPRILPPRNRLLVGRGPILDQVVAQLGDGGVVTLYGLPGAGKTTVAAEIAHDHPGLVCWVPAEDSAAVLNGLAELAARLGVGPGLSEAELLESLWLRLSQQDDWLIVFDNAEHPDSVRAFVPPLRNGRLLVTSRSPAWSSLGATVKIGPLDDEAALAFVRRRTGRVGDDATLLAQAMGRLPLALEQACSYIDETGMSLGQYLRILQHRQTELLSRGAPAGHPHPVTTTWALVFEDVRRRSALAAQILEVSAYLSAEGLPLSMLEAAVETAGDELQMADALAELLRFSIVDRAGSTLRVHRLVQSVVRSRLSPQERRERAAAALRSLQACAPAGPAVAGSWPAWSLATPHVLAYLRAVADSEVLPEGSVELAMGCYRYLRARAARGPAHELLDVVIELVEAVRGRVPLLGELYADRADILDAEGQLAPARAELERALAVFGQNLDSVPEVTQARTWVRLAHILNCSDEPVASAEHYRRALPLLRGPDGEPEEVIRSLIGLGYACWGQGHFAAAEVELRSALELLTDQGWTRHPLHPEAVSALGMMLHEQGRWPEARDLQLQALEEMAEVLGAGDHPSVAYTFDKLGYVEGLLGEHRGSLAHHAAAVAMLERIFGPNDARLAMVISNLGNAQLASGDPAAAAASQGTAYAILLDHYGSEHRDTQLVSTRVQGLLVEAG